MPDLIPQGPVESEPGNDRATERLVRAWRELLHALREFLRGRVDAARPWLNRTEDQVSGMEQDFGEHSRRAASATDAYVRSKPWQALGIAAGLALLVGTLLRRR